VRSWPLLCSLFAWRFEHDSANIIWTGFRVVTELVLAAALRRSSARAGSRISQLQPQSQCECIPRWTCKLSIFIHSLLSVLWLLFLLFLCFLFPLCPSSCRDKPPRYSSLLIRNRHCFVPSSVVALNDMTCQVSQQCSLVSTCDCSTPSMSNLRTLHTQCISHITTSFIIIQMLYVSASILLHHQACSMESVEKKFEMLFECCCSQSKIGISFV
jgi:hypothetical protein